MLSLADLQYPVSWVFCKTRAATDSVSFSQAPFWWTTWALGSSGSLLSPVSLSPHIYISVNLAASLLWFLCLLLIILCGMPSSRSPGWTGDCVPRAPLGDSLSCSVVSWIIWMVQIICIRYSVNATCKLWFVALFLYTQHLLYVCPSCRRDPSSVALPEVSSIIFFLPCWMGLFFSPINIANFSSLKSRV